MPDIELDVVVSPVGAALLNTPSPSAVSWIRVNADNSVTYRSAAQTLSDLGAQASLGYTPENVANKATDFTIVNDTLYPTVQAAKTYMDGLVVGLLDDRGNFDASGGGYPASGGSGTAGAILKGDLWYISVAGTIGTVGSSVRALVDTPGQTASNWDVLNVGLGYIPLNQASNLSDVASVSSARTNLGATTVGANIFTATNPSAVTFIRINADNTVSLLSANNTLNALLPAQSGATTGLFLKSDGTNASWAAAGGGITQDGATTAITGGTTGDLLINIGGFVGSTTSAIARGYRASQGTPYSTGYGYQTFLSASFTGLANTGIGYQALKAATTQQYSTAIGYQALTAATTSPNGAAFDGSTAIGSLALSSQTTGYANIGIGYQGGYSVTTGAENVYIGRTTGGVGTNDVWNVFLGNTSGVGSSSASYVVCLGGRAANANNTNCIALGVGATNSANNELMIGGDANVIGASASGITTVCVGNGNTHFSASSVTFRVTSGSGSDNQGGNMIFQSGRSTGNKTGGYHSWTTSDAGASAATLRAATEKARLVGGGDFVLGIASDTKGLVLKDSAGHYWRISVSTLGVLSTADLGTSIPT